MSETKEPRRFGNVELLHKISLVWLLMAVACVPVWWKTTSVERYPIPYDQISQCSQRVSQLPQAAESLMTLSESYDILVTLVLPDIYADWNIEEASEHLDSWTQSMKHIANFSISSQIIYHPISVGGLLGARLIFQISSIAQVNRGMDSRIRNQNCQISLIRLKATYSQI